MSQTIENFETIWIDLHKKLRSFVRSKIEDKHNADDILQEVFITIHQKIDALEDHTKLIPWAFQIARNKIIDFYRESGKKNQGIIALEAYESQTENETHEAVNSMLNLMNKLPDAYCEALCLTELKGMSQKQYAEQLGISYSGAKSRVQRARLMLKEIMQNCCHFHFDKYGNVLKIEPIPCCKKCND